MFGERIFAVAKPGPVAKAIVGAIALLGGGGMFAPARGDIKVRYPIIDYRELEF